MFDTITCFYTNGTGGKNKPWGKQEKIKFLCPVPGYDRHFSITEYYGFEMIEISMNENGPCMDEVERLVKEDETIKGIWCVPKYSNPTGAVYSDETIKRFAKLKPKAKDFKIMWDNAYCVHHLTDEKVNILNILDECKKAGNEDMPIVFSSASKITFAGGGVAAFACSKNNMNVLKNRYSYQTVCFDKLNQLRHALFLKDYNNIEKLMEKHKNIIAPKFKEVENILYSSLNGIGIAKWTTPKGGYFVSVNLIEGTAKEVVNLCKEAGVKLTSAGATYPLKKDKNDSNIRIAPTYITTEELKEAMKLFCICIKIAAIGTILK
eukprot:TRINITY_DN8510_c0_g2_i2.p1 TRINITY_DN8510_c0_g2~~TRINITY_DN8510_c0_g2_i2.p1  ORF type:complete len:368 (-),score=-36.27 TRINITY_DN8510_c0_g2_i2:107-1069(-)